MMRTVSLSDICTKITSGGTPLTKRGDYYGGGIPWLRTQEINFCNIYSTEKTITELGLKHSSAKIIPKDSVIVAMYGATAGKSAINKIPLATNQACCNLIIDNSKADYRFVYYYLVNSYEKLLSAAVGAAQQNLGSKQISAMTINLPLLDQQKKIADILGSLDEEIELNRRMNETLEQLGQALFRRYFVDNPETKKWKKRLLGEFFPVRTGKKDANFGVKDGRFPFFTCGQTISRAPGYSFNGSAILLAGNGDFNIKYYTGKFEAYQRTYVLIPHNKELLGFLYFLMKKDLPLITGGSCGSVIKFITKGMIENYKVILPDNGQLAVSASVFNKLLKTISHNNEQVRSLTVLRDSLLPKLISGEIEI